MSWTRSLVLPAPQCWAGSSFTRLRICSTIRPSLIHGHTSPTLRTTKQRRARILTASNQNKRNLLSRRSTNLLREAIRTVIHLNTHAVRTLSAISVM